MPNAKVLSEKQAIVAALAERLNSASAGVFVDYKGITVDEDTKLRTELRQNDVEYSVVKNTLTRFALKDAGLEAMSDLLNGTTSLATSTADPIVPIRMIHDMSEKMAKDNKFIVKGAFLRARSSMTLRSRRSRSSRTRMRCTPRSWARCWHPSRVWPFA